MKTLADQIKDLENTRAAKMARMESITNKSVEEGRSFDAAEAEEFDDLSSEIAQIDDDHARYTKLLKMQAGSAQPVNHQAAATAANKSIGEKAPMVITRKADADDKFEGQAFTRITIAKTLAKLEGMGAAMRHAEKAWGRTNPNLVEHIKADVAGGGSGSGEWGAELVSQDTWAGDFQEYLYGQTVYNQLPLREVPANVTIKGQDGASSAYWVGESKAIPVTTADFNDVTLSPLKVGTIAVVSKELLRDSSPSAEVLVRDSIVEAARQKIDSTFVGSSAGTAGTTPAGILYNIAGTTSAGTDGSSVLNDIKELKYRFIAAKNMGGLYFVMNPALASSIGLLRNALDQREFPGLNEMGGNLEGTPVIVGDNVNANHLILLKPSDIYRIGMGAMDVSVSDVASIEMANNPGQDTDTPTAATGKVVSMFQTESVALKVVQSMNFARRRESAVAWINDADYGGAIST